MNDMNIRPDPSRGYPGRTYRFYTGYKIYEFGAGLSYTNFTYKFLSAPNRLNLLSSLKTISSRYILHHKEARSNFIEIDELASCQSLVFNVKVSVTNVGDMNGSHVVMLFARVPKAVNGSPAKQLIGFVRIHTNARESTETSIEVDPCLHLSFANGQGKRVLPVGNYVLLLGELQHLVSIEM